MALLHNIYRFSFTLHVVCLASKALHKFWRGSYLVYEDAICSDLCLEVFNLCLHDTAIVARAKHISYGANRYDNGADSYDDCQGYPKDIYIPLSLFILWGCCLFGHIGFASSFSFALYGMCINLCVWIEMFHSGCSFTHSTTSAMILSYTLHSGCRYRRHLLRTLWLHSTAHSKSS